jgi:hypothetical protein
MRKRLERLKNTANKYMADIRPDRLPTCQSERKSVVSRRPIVLWNISRRYEDEDLKHTIAMRCPDTYVLILLWSLELKHSGTQNTFQYNFLKIVASRTWIIRLEPNNGVSLTGHTECVHEWRDVGLTQIAGPKFLHHDIQIRPVLEDSHSQNGERITVKMERMCDTPMHSWNDETADVNITKYIPILLHSILQFLLQLYSFFPPISLMRCLTFYFQHTFTFSWLTI